MENNIGFLTANQLFSANDTETILNSTAKELKKSFYHYTKQINLKSILTKDEKSNRFFFVNNIIEMNDIDEFKLHEKMSKRIHSFCTCSTRHEKIPLWYLYSGVSGRGARIGFTPGVMLKFLNSIDTIYPVENKRVVYQRPLRKNIDFELLCGWVFYVMDGNNRVLYRNKIINIEEITPDEMGENYFIKKYPWEYESEFRVVILNKNQETYSTIAIPLLDSVINNIEIMSAPECRFSPEDKDWYINAGIKRDKIRESKLKIKMRLLKSDINEIVNQVPEWCDNEECFKLCTIIKSNAKCAMEVNKK